MDGNRARFPHYSFNLDWIVLVVFGALFGKPPRARVMRGIVHAIERRKTLPNRTVLGRDIPNRLF
jgi:hypothetical protein